MILPEAPMQGRFADPRVGYFTEEYTDYAHAKQWAAAPRRDHDGRTDQ